MGAGGRGRRSGVVAEGRETRRNGEIIARRSQRADGAGGRESPQWRRG
jgi:hypothetical protein